MKKRKSGRIIGVFGLPCSGKTTIIKALMESSRELMAHISTGDIARKLSDVNELANMADGNLFSDEDKMRSELLSMINKRKSQGAEVIFLDSCPRFDDQVHWMISQQLVGPDEGCLIKITGDNLIDRAKERMRDDQDATDKLTKKIVTQSKFIDSMERAIFYYSIPYFTIMNHDLEHAVRQLAKYAGLRK